MITPTFAKSGLSRMRVMFGSAAGFAEGVEGLKEFGMCHPERSEGPLQSFVSG
jgi:hypothetical protein